MAEVKNMLTARCAVSFEAVFRTLAGLSREDANRWMDENLNKLSGEHWDKYRAARQMELRHIKHVRKVMKKLGGGQDGQSKNEHDFSKDEWYFLVTIGKFTMGCSDVVGDAFQTAIDCHYELEPHHPEHEKVAGKECTADDIIEMAVDRLSRNLQKNQGEYNFEQMKKFEPVFPVAREWKMATYRDAVEQKADLAKQLWLEMDKLEDFSNLNQLQCKSRRCRRMNQNA